jgi:hypothetical protein
VVCKNLSLKPLSPKSLLVDVQEESSARRALLSRGQHGRHLPVPQGRIISTGSSRARVVAQALGYSSSYRLRHQ